MRQHELIAYAGGPSHHPTYSYIDVLRGQIPAHAFAGKYVLVGAAASGLGGRVCHACDQRGAPDARG